MSFATVSEASSTICADERVSVVAPATSPSTAATRIGGVGGAGDVVRDIGGGGVLLLYRRRDRRGGFVDLLHAHGDAADRLDRTAGRSLHGKDVIGDLFRGLRGLHRE